MQNKKTENFTYPFGMEGMDPKERSFERGAGVLLPVFSLPSPYGMGSFSEEAYHFIDFLSGAKVKYWQILPMGPINESDSPYQTYSSFAGNPYFISLEDLLERGLLYEGELEGLDFGDGGRKIQYDLVKKNKAFLFRRAYSRIGGGEKSSMESFLEENSSWLKDYALYMALKEKFSGAIWQTWPEEIRDRRDHALEKYWRELKDEVYYQVFLQWIFFCEWQALKDYSHKNGVKIIGDLSIYVALDSCDAWANREILDLDERGRALSLGGAPPDYYSEDGQLWGNPCYKWDILKENNYSFWRERIGQSLKLYDIIRLDHFRGFSAYWSVDGEDETARFGRWKRGPGEDLFNSLEDCLGPIPIIAEDLGYITSDVRDLRDEFSFPGMNVILFAFDGGGDNPYLPHNLVKNSVNYTSTHDSDTLKGWYEGLDEYKRGRVKSYCAINEEEGPIWGLIRTVLSSVSDLAIIQFQDLLELGNEFRTNIPGTVGDNWRFRALRDDFRCDLQGKLAQIIDIYGR